jgi:hypothetical protein
MCVRFVVSGLEVVVLVRGGEFVQRDSLAADVCGRI